MAPTEGGNPEAKEFTFTDDTRVTIKYKAVYKFVSGDKVYIVAQLALAQKVPYRINEAEDGRYTLCDDQGEPVFDDQQFEENELVLVKEATTL